MNPNIVNINYILHLAKRFINILLGIGVQKHAVDLFTPKK